MWWLCHNFIIYLQQIAVDILAYYAGVYQSDRVKSCKCAFSQWNEKNVQEIIAQNDRAFYFKLNSLFDGLTDICGCFACIFLAVPCFCLLPHINNNDNGYYQYY